MDKHNDINKFDAEDFHFLEKRSSVWPWVIGIGILGLSAVLLVAYSIFEIGSVAMAFISEQTLRPVVLLVVVLVAIVVLFLIP